MKTAAVVISGLPAGQNVREIEVRPGTTAGDVLRALNLNGYLLSREGSAQAFAAEEGIYEAISDGQKLRCTPIAEVGSFVDWVLEILGIARPDEAATSSSPRLHGRKSAARCRVISATRQVTNPGKIAVSPDTRNLWELRGWRRDGGAKLRGAFRTPRGSFAGEISLENRGRPDFFIVNPPPALLKGAHGACFRSRGGGRYFVHFGLTSPEVDSGIVAIEKLLANVLGVKA